MLTSALITAILPTWPEQNTLPMFSERRTEIAIQDEWGLISLFWTLYLSKFWFVFFTCYRCLLVQVKPTFCKTIEHKTQIKLIKMPLRRR